VSSDYFEGEVEPRPRVTLSELFDLTPPPKSNLPGVQCPTCGRFMKHAGYRLSQNPYTGDDWWVVGECSRCGVADN